LVKEVIRKEVLRERNALTPDAVAEKSARIVKKLVTVDGYRNAINIMTYINFRNEVQTGNFIRKAMAGGKRVSVPVTDVDNRRLTPSLLVDYPGDLQPGTWGIWEPKPECVRVLDPSELDLVVVPGVAFDLKGNRLGYGGGFYDRFLKVTKPGTVFVGLAFDFQIRPFIFPEVYDIPVHLLLTEYRLIHTD